MLLLQQLELEALSTPVALKLTVHIEVLPSYVGAMGSKRTSLRYVYVP